MCKIIAIANQKGGVAKTTTTINLGVGLSKVGKRVMLIDADPQGHLTMGLGFPKNLGEQQQLDEIVALIVETISIERENITISGVKYPYQFVKSRLLLLEESHIEYVLDSKSKIYCHRK